MRTVMAPSKRDLYYIPGAQPALHFGGGQFSWNFIRWRHRAYSTVEQLFRKWSHIIIMYFCARRHEVHSTNTHILHNPGK